jgi:ATP-binding cassette subfamily B (MDR/TAP) protein 1
MYGAYALSFYFGTTGILDGWASPGTVVTVFLAILAGAFSIADVSPNIMAVASAQGAVVKLYETIDRVPVIDSESDGGLRPDTVEGVIEIEVRYWPV